MYNLLTLNKIAKCGLDNFNKAKYSITDNCDNPDCIILRSFNMHDMELADSLQAVARAGAGVNNIPIDKCSEKGIVVFNTPGANANAVKELTIAGLFLASRDVIGGVNWAQTLKGNGAEVGKMVEKGKSNFAGCEIKGKKLAVIGLGAIGVLVANAAHHLGMDIIGYDPYISVKAALSLDRHTVIKTELKDALAEADYITLHLPLTADTKGMFNAELFKTAVKKGAKLLNFSRGELVDASALKSALEVGLISSYVVDFPSDEVLGLDNVVAIPHLGASSAESEDNCAVMAAKELIDYMENGNIVNSVNFPNCELARTENTTRLTILHKNVPNILSSITSIFSQKSVNIENLMNKSKNDYACTILDVASDVQDDVVNAIKAIDGMIKVRVI
ncbi:MAG: phosphoglycerate dehydrogenase [Clostridia bacterium]|nr:phosphoglycerate dehydrogenase [Clostridia bacterium]MBQ6938185.1 phosphoglycerate dehydrogenase [Clostridia bacterium]MBR2883541.1 phosphoglycerate dehydrogenase [Clostridia bacterium]